MELWRSCETIRIISGQPQRAAIASLICSTSAELALAFRPIFAQRGDGTCLDDLEKVETRRGTHVLALFDVESFQARLHGRDAGAGLGEVAVAAGQLQGCRQRESGRPDQADEREKSE